MKLGTTYSNRHAQYLGLDEAQAMEELTAFGFDIIRLGCYWDEIEPEEGKFDLEAITSQLAHCELKNQDIVLTIGMKAPRWPEFFLPGWVDFHKKDELLSSVKSFIERTVKELKDFTCIKYWQVENEPFSGSGPDGYFLSTDFVKEEIKTLRSIDDSREVIVTFWGNDFPEASIVQKATQMADIVGFDIYYQQWKGHIHKHGGPVYGEWGLRRALSKISKPIWITELQAEIWEDGDYKEIMVKPGDKPSASPELLKKNFEKAIKLHPDAILFWGFEYWFWKKLHGEPGMWEMAKNLIKNQNV